MVTEHVRNLFKEFIINSSDCSTKADLMPFDPKINTPLTSVDKANVHSYSYWVLSGQHSIEAAKYCKSIEIHLYEISSWSMPREHLE